MTDLREVVDVVIGVDTHVHTHSAAIVDARTGGVLEEITVEATADGYAQLVAFADEHAVLRAWAIEGTGGHGAGLTRHLERDQEVVIELDRPERAKRRHGAKSDPLDAIRAAREALSRPRLGGPRSGGDRQALSVLLAARRSAVNAAGDAQRQVFSLVIAAPEQIRARFRGQKLPAMLKTAAGLRVHASWDVETATTVTVLRSLARRAHALAEEAAEHEKAIRVIVRSWRPDLLEQLGVGPIVAATVLCAWSHPGRIHSEAAFAMLAGVAPIPANSGQITTRHRLNRYGDRQLNRALHTIVLSRIRYHQATRDYVARRTSEGKTPREIKRCLKRYIARDLYRLLEHHPVRA
ncbi:IS110 family transposase [Nocardioides guangzhouensis]|uniref:IS110 family transposase n=1 Tax=Nocardioides guangzhouensis TaxID=2497878 RepID=A0A4Q4YZ30_9ACTN|nr:IS110 family transposase [Nocardioides guangzhouensis]